MPCLGLSCGPESQVTVAQSLCVYHGSDIQMLGWMQHEALGILFWERGGLPGAAQG